MTITAYLPSKCKEMHNVIKDGGVLQVSAVHVHCLHKLLSPCGALLTEGIKVSVGQVGDTAHKSVKFCERRRAQFLYTPEGRLTIVLTRHF